MTDQLNFDFSDANADSGGSNALHKMGANPKTEPSEQQDDLFNGDGDALGQSSEKSYEKWREAQRDRLRKFAASIGLPLGRNVELTLHNGTVLRGRLQLSSTSNERIRERTTDRKLRNALRLVINRADFTAADVASCVRVDA